MLMANNISVDKLFRMRTWLKPTGGAAATSPNTSYSIPVCSPRIPTSMSSSSMRRSHQRTCLSRSCPTIAVGSVPEFAASFLSRSASSSCSGVNLGLRIAGRNRGSRGGPCVFCSEVDSRSLVAGASGFPGTAWSRSRSEDPCDDSWAATVYRLPIPTEAPNAKEKLTKTSRCHASRLKCPDCARPVNGAITMRHHTSHRILFRQPICSTDCFL